MTELPLLQRIKNSLFYRSKYALEKIETKRLLRELGAAGSANYPLELTQNIASIKSLCSDVDALVDIGAYQGLFTALFHKIFTLKSSICVEPNEKMLPLIRENCADLEMELYNHALAEKEELKKYYQHEDSSMNSIVAADETVLLNKFTFDNPDKITVKEVQTLTLDKLVFDVAKIDSKKIFIKIDTQGSELNVLKGGIQTLQATRYCLVEHIFLNPYKSDYTFEHLSEFMRSMNFRCLGALSVIHTQTHEISAVDFLFEKK